MKKLLFILAILLISTTWSKGQIFNTGQTKPTVITPLQGTDNISFYLDKSDTVLWAKLGRFGDYKLWSAKKIRHVLDSLANAIGTQIDSLGNKGYFTNYKALGKEDKANKVTSLSSSSTDVQYPSAKTVFDGLEGKVTVSPPSAQTGNVWMNGDIKTTGDYIIQASQDGQVNYIYPSNWWNGGTRAGGVIKFRTDGSSTDRYLQLGMISNDASLDTFSPSLSINYDNTATFSSTVNSTGILLNGVNVFSSLTPGWVTKWDGSKFVDLENNSTQTLSGTNVTWNLANGKNATLILTGNTVITLSNATEGLSGTLWVTNASSTYTIQFAGYVNSIDPFIRLSSNMVITSGGSKYDDYSFKCRGTKLNWNGTLDRQ